MQVFFRQSCEYMQLFNFWKCIEFSSLLVPDGYLCPHFIQVVQVNITIQNGLLLICFCYHLCPVRFGISSKAQSIII